jgi:dolichyl-phosphate beta-glucosyltransferase
MTTIVVVIPCFNEARRLPTETLERFAASHSNVRFVLVDDGSTDETLGVLRKLAASRPSAFSVVSLPHNMGKAEAVRRGMTAAHEQNPSFVAYWDADLSTPLQEIDRFRDVLEGNAAIVAVLGSRVRRLGADIQRRAGRHYLGRLFATAASMVLRLPTYDTQCGAKMFRVGPEVSAAFSEPFLSRWIFDVELLARLVVQVEKKGNGDAARAFFEVPLVSWRDVKGSKLGPRNMFSALVDLARIWHRCRRGHHI